MTANINELNKSSQDKPRVLIVGAGPAGLFCADTIKNHACVTVIDKGKNISERSHSKPIDLSSGIGGTGLYSDGKLCLDLEVGGFISKIISIDKKLTLERKIADTLLRRAKDIKFNYKNHNLQTNHSEGLASKKYPVINIGTDRGATLISKFIKDLSSDGVIFRSESNLKKLERAGNNFTAHIINSEVSFREDYDFVLLAMGKIGSKQQQSICNELGVRSQKNPMNIGLRLETCQDSISNLFNDSDDPKLKLILDDGSYVKTHCASNGGFVTPVYYEEIYLTGGHQYSNKNSERSGFSIVWNGLRLETNELDDVIYPNFSSYGKALACQKVSDFLAKKMSTKEDLDKINLSYKDITAANFWDLLPEKLNLSIKEMLINLSKISKHILNEDSVLYGPVIEWWMSTISTRNEKMETSVENLFVAGDGSGWSQGIVHSAATGILAGEGIIDKLSSQ
ncbi:MAG: NAD(P)/FAD-dependent oxidoreductase [Alteromonadaceae bacterium]|nr:NAD(P)/FAD-dependent oxidoreductase [Alteromonadaceae bacterium]